MFSGITDCYQPIEAAYGLTRACLQVCIEFKNPASVVTKGFLVVRDADLLAELERVVGAGVAVSIPFAEAKTAGLIEPQAPPPARRFEAIRRLSEAGVPVTVMVAPIIPGLNDRDVPRILEQAAAAGATSAGYTALRLPGSVETVFLSRLREALPLRADRIINRIRDVRGGRMSDPRFGSRMRGSGTYWDSIRDLFEISKKRFGLNRDHRHARARTLTPSPSQGEGRGEGGMPASPAHRSPAANYVQLGFDFTA
jgi:DNA repair photolyase